MKLRTDRYSHVKSVLSTGSVQILSVKEQCGVELAGHLCPVVGLLHLLRRGPTMLHGAQDGADAKNDARRVFEGTFWLVLSDAAPYDVRRPDCS